MRNVFFVLFKIILVRIYLLPFALNAQSEAKVISGTIDSLRLETSISGDSVIFFMKNIGHKLIDVPPFCINHNRIILVTPDGKELIYNMWVEPAPNQRGKSIYYSFYPHEIKIEKHSLIALIAVYEMMDKFPKGNYQLYWMVYSFKSNKIEFMIN